jgi:predicted RNA binding protein YcfA (HicA-like mRNA interferase family)
MSGLHNLKPDRVVKAFERAGWHVERQTGSHAILSREGNPNT